MYTNLVVKSDFSFTEGASKIKDLVSKAKSLGHKSIALTDRNNMFGAYDFSKIAKAAGIQPIIGCQIPILYNKEENKSGYLTFLAQTEKGYENLCYIMCESQKPNSDKTNPFSLDIKALMANHEDIIILSGSDDGPLVNLLKEGKIKEARELVSFFTKLVKDRFYIQINRNRTPNKDDKAIQDTLLDIASDTTFKIKRLDGTSYAGIPVIATSEVRYTDRNRHDAYEILRAIDEGRKISIDDKEILKSDDRFFDMKNNAEFFELFKDIPEAIENTLYLPQRCGFMVKGRDPILPPFETEGGRSENDELRIQSFEGLKVRLKGRNLTQEKIKEYEDRLDFELGIIKNMGFPGYFLIVSDFIKWAKSQDIPVGPGRGSGAGSMVAYCLMITDLDPFQFGLLFERFLNPERVSMPDFDVDFCQNRREEVIQYVQKRYGTDKVSQISTFGEIKSKNAIKDAGRVIIHEKFGGYGFGETNEFTKLIPKKENSAEPKGLQEAFDTTPELMEKIESSEKMKILFENALKIEGMYRSSGSHAAGVIIGDRPLHQLVPIKWDDNTGMPLSQFNMKAAESAGLVKFDFLGLKTLSVIKETVDLIKENRNETIDISNISLEDQNVFEMLQKGQSNGVFQFESAGMQNVLRQVKPTRIEDLIAVNALYRPGPMDQIEHYANCKNGVEEPYYPNPVERTKPFLEETYGIMVYQEQVMKVAQEVAGYSLGAADLLRRAMGKKIKEEMDAQKAQFVAGAVERGTSDREASNLFDTIAKFAGYGFNKSHAAAYAYIAYQTAWLKRYYPAEFFAALMSFEEKPERMALIKEDMDNFSVRMLPPDINKSHGRFKPESDPKSEGGYGIRFGLSAIKQISGDLVDFINERKNGQFRDLKDFTKRSFNFFNKAKIEKMAEAGAFDSLNPNRYSSVSTINWFAKNNKSEILSQDSLFGDVLDEIPDDIKDVADWGNRIEREYNAVGFYFHNHPIDTYLPRLIKAGIRRLSSLREYMVDKELAELSNKKICVMVENVFLKYSRNNKLYLTARVAEKGDSFDIPFFGNRNMTIEEAQEILTISKNNRTPVVVDVNVSLEDNGTRVRVYSQKFYEVESYLKEIRGDMILTIDTNNISLRNDEYNMEKEAKTLVKESKISEEEYNERLNKVFIHKVSSRMKELKSYLNSIEVEDKTPSSVGIHLVLKTGDKILESKKLAGKFLFTPVSEAQIKTMDGIVSVSEKSVLT